MQIGLLADTHVPYRASRLPPEVFPALEGVDLILHAGDVDEPWALKSLKRLGPLYAVRGNYHLFDRSDAGRSLPISVELNLVGFRVALIHGHQIGPSALFWKVWVAYQNLRGRWEIPAYDAFLKRQLCRRFPEADIIVFGHTHRYCEVWQDGVLVINPGAALYTSYLGMPLRPSVARLQLERGRRPIVRRIDLQPTLSVR
ncbi:MAG: metallophosphoesterase family protein [Anaerolineae bacterium]